MEYRLAIAKEIRRERMRGESEYDTGRGLREWEQYTYIYKEQYTETEIETQMR